eukprot:6213074-Pleurochrysis_carterae.AAC.2
MLCTVIVIDLTQDSIQSEIMALYFVELKRRNEAKRSAHLLYERIQGGSERWWTSLRLAERNA